jgi:hypothetical protein
VPEINHFEQPLELGFWNTSYKGDNFELVAAPEVEPR